MTRSVLSLKRLGRKPPRKKLYLRRSSPYPSLSATTGDDDGGTCVDACAQDP